jgi:hypothetical protein
LGHRLRPTGRSSAQRLVDYIDIADFPVRTGTHLNSAFALIMALFYAKSDQHLLYARRSCGRRIAGLGMTSVIRHAMNPVATSFYRGLVEAVLMRHVLDDCSFGDWWEMFSPGEAELAMWLTPVTVADRTDPKMSHLDGLNLSRAWCWRVLGPGLPPVLQLAIRAWSDHLEASLPLPSKGIT